MPWQSEIQPIGPGAARLRPLDAADAASHIDFKGAAPKLWPWVAGAAAFAVGAAAAVLLEHFARAPASAAPAASGTVNLAWPGLAVLAILVIFFAVRRATGERRRGAPRER